jgi:3-oxoacyl-(acyl-carrier-protein) synthase
MQAVASAMILKEQRIPAAMNYDREHGPCCLNTVSPPGLPGPVQLVLQNSFGFSGKTSCLLLGRLEGGVG